MLEYRLINAVLLPVMVNWSMMRLQTRKTMWLNENKAVYTSQSRVQMGRGSDGKGLPKHLARSSNAKTTRNAKKVNEDRRTERVVESRARD